MVELLKLHLLELCYVESSCVDLSHVLNYRMLMIGSLTVHNSFPQSSLDR